MTASQNILFLQNRVAYARDEDAYKKIFYHFHPKLYRFCYSLTNDSYASDEMVSDVMLKIWLMEQKLAYIDKLDSYLFRAVKNAALSYLSKQKSGNLNVDDLQQTIFAKNNDNAESHMMNLETKDQLEIAVSSLPTQCQMVFRLIREEGFSYKQVGAILEISQNTIETHMRIALKRIKLQLDKYLMGSK